MSGRGGEGSGALFDARVWKFHVPTPGPTCRSWIDVPDGTTLHSVGLQGDEMVVWGLVPDEDAQTVTRRLIVANTGAVVPSFPAAAKFLGTVTHLAGIVWHVWDGDES
jgi:hypothetical protein